MSTPTDFDFTSHSVQRGLERGITKEDFISCVVSPDKKSQKSKGQTGGFIYLFEKNIKQKLLVVVAEVYKEKCNLITGYWNETHDSSDKQ